MQLAIRNRFKALECSTSLVRNQEVSYFVPFVPVGLGRSLQRVEGTNLIKVLVVSIPTAPTYLLSDEHVRRPFVFQSEQLFQLTASQCVP